MMRRLSIARGRTRWLLAQCAGILIVTAPAYPRAGETATPLTIRITSPLGRTGLHGAIRLVAQVKHAPEVHLPVKFFVDGRFHGEAIEGPPFAVEWVDENPYEPREISAEVCDAKGDCARDVVKLEPMTIVEEAEVSSVLVEAAVQDATGKSINGLTTESFTLVEDDVPQTLDLVRSDVVDSTYILLVDSSQSMARRLEFVQQAAGRLLGHLPTRDRVIVAPFSRKVEAVTGPTNDRVTAIEAIGAIRSRGGTAIMDVLTDLPRLAEGTTGRLTAVLITDGYDEHSSKTIEDAIRAVKSAQATLFVVGIGGVAGISIKGERMLRQVAEQSGGRAFFPSRDEELHAVHGLIAADVQSRYLLAYTPTNRQLDGGWRHIRVATTSPKHVVRARPGYFAPKPPPIRATLEFTAANRDRTPVEIAADDLTVFEDGTRQTLESFQEALAPISIVLAVDASGSMKGAVDAVKEGARQFVDALRPQDRLALIVFSDESLLIHDLTERREGTHQAIDQYQVRGGTALHDALFDAMKRLGPVEGRRAVVLVTDGRDENGPGTGPGSRHTRAEVLGELRMVDAAVYSIGLGSSVDRDGLEEFARESGGEAFFPELVQDLADDYRRVIEHLRRRYVATFLSSNTNRDGGWRAVEITSQDPRVVIRSRGGYRAPEH
jgi:Ca-activated chloride channel family protein